jgi:death-on-curing protein
MLHDIAIAEYGGSNGVRDMNLLESAIAQPSMFLFGQYVHNDIFHMAAAYSFHIIKNHPFVDGNKRTGIVSALAFLERNGIIMPDDFSSLYNFALEIASSKLDKEQIAEFYKNSAEK